MLNKIALPAVIAAFFHGCSTPSTAPSAAASSELEAGDKKPYLIVAHRGYSSKAPENTLAAFEAALHAKADMVELDYHVSKDNVAIVIHDKTLDRTTNAEEVTGQEDIAVATSDMRLLGKLDAGSWFGADYKGTRIPTLEESLDLIQAGGTTLIERKGGDAESLSALLQEKKLIDKVVVQSFDWDFLASLRRIQPTMRLFVLGAGPLTDQMRAKIPEIRPEAVGWRYSDVDSRFVEELRQLRLKIFVYTVNSPDEAVRLADLGVTGFITDNPEEIREGLEKR